MRIKELEDVLVLVDAMPRYWQEQVVTNVSLIVDDYEERAQHPELCELEYLQLKIRRLREELLARSKKKPPLKKRR